MDGSSNNLIGELFKQLRIESGQTLRAFCKAHGFDPGNISRIERGRMAPPEAREKLDQYADALGLRRGSERYQHFIDVAAASKGRVPDDILSDEELVLKLPAVFRTLRGSQADGNTLDELADAVRRA